MPETPTSCSASFTSSSLKGLMIASIFFTSIPCARYEPAHIHTHRVQESCQGLRAGLGDDLGRGKAKPRNKAAGIRQDEDMRPMRPYVPASRAGRCCLVFGQPQSGGLVEARHQV